MAVRVRITANGIIEEQVTDVNPTSEVTFDVPVTLTSETSTSESIGTLAVTSQLQPSGSTVFPLAAAVQVIKEAQDPSWTQVDVSGKTVVPVSASITGTVGGFTVVGATPGQMCIFVNTGPKTVRMAPLADSTYPNIPPNMMFQALFIGSNWYKMSGSY
jgi:hypothetical protein